MDLATISKEQLRVYQNGNWKSPSVTHPSSAINGDGIAWSPDGGLLGVLNAEGGVTVFDATDNYKIVFEAKKQVNAIRHFYFSPGKSFLVTYERYVSKDDKDNVFCHSLKGGAIGIQIKLRSLTEHNWPAFTWSPDERICLHMTTNTVKVMHGRSLSLQSPLYSLTIPNIAQYVLSPNGDLLAGFFPESKGQPAALRVFDVTDRSARPRASKASFNAQNAKIMWNTSSTALLAIFSTDSDATSSNYYGTSSLFFMRVNDQGEMTASQLITGDSGGGPCHDACWSPTGDEFIAATGKMPAEIALYDGKTGVKKMSFGVTRRNTLRWSPFGRTFTAGGFGNLPGDIDVWDKNKGLCLSTVRVPCTVLCEWGPDGRNFLTASTFPRMRVDNFVQIINYDGTVVSKTTDLVELYGCKWRPRAENDPKFVDCPPSPRVVQNAKKPLAGDESPEPVRQAYRPPGGSGALAEQMRKERELENQKKAVKVKVEKTTTPSIPGFLPATGVGPSASALRNARKKKAQAFRKEEENIEEEQEVKVVNEKENPLEGPTEPAKRIRNLQKKLKEIASLKAIETPLNAAQQAKVDSESAVLAEIAELEKMTQQV